MAGKKAALKVTPSKDEGLGVKMLRADEKRKITLCLSVGTDALLSALAKMKGCDRSTEAERLILAARSEVTIKLRGKEYAAELAG